MRYFLDTDGGFTVVDDAARVSAYAYPSSNSSQAASRSAYHAGQIAARMIQHARDSAPFCYPRIVEESYVRHAARLDAVGVREAVEG